MLPVAVVLMVMFAPHVAEPVAALSEAFSTVKTLVGPEFEVDGLDVELDVSEVVVTVRAGAGGLVTFVDFGSLE